MYISTELPRVMTTVIANAMSKELPQREGLQIYKTVFENHGNWKSFFSGEKDIKRGEDEVIIFTVV